MYDYYYGRGSPWWCGNRCYQPRYHGGYNPYYGGGIYNSQLQSVNQSLVNTGTAIGVSQIANPVQIGSWGGRRFLS